MIPFPSVLRWISMIESLLIMSAVVGLLIADEMRRERKE